MTTTTPTTTREKEYVCVLCERGLRPPRFFSRESWGENVRVRDTRPRGGLASLRRDPGFLAAASHPSRPHSLENGRSASRTVPNAESGSAATTPPEACVSRSLWQRHPPPPQRRTLWSPNGVASETGVPRARADAARRVVLVAVGSRLLRGYHSRRRRRRRRRGLVVLVGAFVLLLATARLHHGLGARGVRRRRLLLHLLRRTPVWKRSRVFSRQPRYPCACVCALDRPKPRDSSTTHSRTL